MICDSEFTPHLPDGRTLLGRAASTDEKRRHPPDKYGPSEFIVGSLQISALLLVGERLESSFVKVGRRETSSSSQSVVIKVSMVDADSDSRT